MKTALYKAALHSFFQYISIILITLWLFSISKQVTGDKHDGSG